MSYGERNLIKSVIRSRKGGKLGSSWLCLLKPREFSLYSFPPYNDKVIQILISIGLHLSHSQRQADKTQSLCYFFKGSKFKHSRKYRYEHLIQNKLLHLHLKPKSFNEAPLYILHLAFIIVFPNKKFRWTKVVMGYDLIMASLFGILVMFSSREFSFLIFIEQNRWAFSESLIPCVTCPLRTVSVKFSTISYKWNLFFYKKKEENFIWFFLVQYYETTINSNYQLLHRVTKSH